MLSTSDRVFIALSLFLAIPLQADEKEICMYRDDRGVVQQVLGESKIPSQFRGNSKCFPVKEGNYLAPPDEIELKGSIRKESLASSLGRISLQWPRLVEKLFGRTPARATTDAARSASRLLKKSGWSTDIRRLDLEWKIVFMDETLPESQIPQRLISNCHPGWMTPPANVYIVAQRAAAGCGGAAPRKSEADGRLAEVLIHEMGHAVEAAMLGDQFGGDRGRAEGFATWFEAEASDESSVIRSGVVRNEHFALARSVLKGRDTLPPFDGSAQGYATQSLLFHAIAESKGIRGITRVYEVMREKKLPFYEAVKDELGWTPERLQEKAIRVVK